MAISYKNMPKFLENQKDFKGTVVSAFHEDGLYKVKQYDTVLAVVFPDGEVKLNANKYTATTSKFQTLLKGCYPNAELVKGDTEYWKENFHKYDPNGFVAGGKR